MVDDVEGAFGIFLVVLVYAFKEGAFVFWRVAFFEVGEVDADDGGDEVRVLVHEFLHPFVVLLGVPTAQTDDVAACEIFVRGVFEDGGVFVVHGDELVVCLVAATASVFDKVDAFFFVLINGHLEGCFDHVLMGGGVSEQADEEVEFGLEAAKVAAVLLGVDEVVFERVKPLGWVGERIFVKGDGVWAGVVGLFVGVGEQGPVDVLVDVAAEVEEVLGGEAAAGVDVEFAGFVWVERVHFYSFRVVLGV